MKRAKILSASAGSGKTYQLTLKYMCDVIQHPERYRNILAVTFTNKATEEMKSRILREIHTLASGNSSPYLNDVKRELGISEAQIREGAKRARTRILHDFSRFTILTIDRFFQRILRAFIKELSLDLNYNIEIDTNQLLERSTDTLIEKITTDEQLRSWLLEFAEERLNDGNKWDMRSDLKTLGSELFKENGAKNIDPKLSKTAISDAVNRAISEGDKYRAELQELGNKALGVMREYHVEDTDFKGGQRSFAKNFRLYANGVLKAPTPTMFKAVDNISEWYTKSASGSVQLASEVLRPILEQICECYATGIKKINTAKLIRDNFRSFALLADLREEVNTICKDENIMVLSKTKDILSGFIDDNNAPFIYEKVGSRYDHYMIDEFQDTSIREWRNMLPLLREALASNPESSVFIVGDIKQSIYRWRGGDWRLLNSDAMLDLGKENTAVEHLQYNYRSLPNIVEFNNKLIHNVVQMDNQFLNTTLSNALAENKIEQATYDSLYDIMSNAYSDYEQKPGKNCGNIGYAEVTAYDPKVSAYPFISAIESAIERGYRYGDILILVRGKNDAKMVANALFEYKYNKFTSKGEAGFNILTPEALTLESCEIAEFITSVMRLTIDPLNDIERAVYNRFLKQPFNRALDEEEIEWLNHTAHLSPLEAFESIVSRFKQHIHKESTAFLQAMHEQILSFSSQRVVDIQYYLKWWDERGKQEAITVEMTDDTIEIMTIHKAKGLERPIVIIPNSRWDMSPRPSLRPIVWAKANNGEATTEIGDYPIMYGPTMENSTFSEEYYKELVMSHVDGINLLYVAVTRASRELYIYVPSSQNSDGGEKISTTAPLILDATATICKRVEDSEAEEDNGTIVYAYGEPTECDNDSRKNGNSDILLEEYESHQPTIKVRYPSHRCFEEGTTISSKALSDGIRLHRLFERALTEEDLRKAVDNMSLDCLIDNKQAESLNANISDILKDSRVKEWFSGEWESVKCENAIIANGEIRRPDRVMISGERVVIVDYKFGDKRSNTYNKQMAEYMHLLSSMGQYSKIEGYVWYISLGDIEKVEL
ncbi:MAG: UvrD-helicase domain-containing protein [Alistipes sp.]|nr:UvrD-helicase domain-containing protein [Alistipes sp.]